MLTRAYMATAVKCWSLAAVLCLCVAIPCGAQVAVDQSGENSNSATQLQGTCVLPSVAANALVLLSEVVDDDGTTTFHAPTATGLTFAQIGTTLRSVNNYYLLLWRAFTSAALGATTITGTWTGTSNDWNFACASVTGTAGTAANNGSDAIGSTNSSQGASTTPSVSVASSGNNNSKYFGVVWYAAANNLIITKGAAFNVVTASLYNGNFEGQLTELSTSPVTPPAATTVNGSISNNVTASGVYGIELLVASAPPPPSSGSCSLAALGVGPC